jgi:hypothetical protein
MPLLTAPLVESLAKLLSFFRAFYAESVLIAAYGSYFLAIAYDLAVLAFHFFHLACRKSDIGRPIILYCDTGI